MCLWLLTACIGLIPTNNTPINNIVIQYPSGVPSPILQPTTAASTTTAAARPPSTMAPPASTSNAAPMTPAPTTTSQPATNQTPMPTAPPAPPASSSAGPLPIDPRLGTTPAASAALRVPPINGYNVNGLTLDTAVKFPRQRRSINESVKSTSIKDFLATFKSFDIVEHRIGKRQNNCACVPTGTCISYGAGQIDLRIVTPGATQCPAGQVYCCTSTITPTSAPTAAPVVTVACGVTQTVPTTAVIPSAGQASFGEYPWQAMILTKQNDYIAGGVLIDQRHVLTVTHRLTGYIVSGTAPNLKVRLGEWDAAGTYEPIPFQEYNIARVFSHPNFNANTLQYDITVLRLSTLVPLTSQTGAAATINRACLPPSTTTVYTGQRCWVSGWGKNMFGVSGQYQQILKEVDVSIVAPSTCQSEMQTARLGATFVLDTTSFICAGGETNKDACTGDGGSGLVCRVNGQWVLVGLVSWGLGCANANVPGAYVNVAALLPWIQQQVAAS